jgi:ribose transport system substrate-binding protein
MTRKFTKSILTMGAGIVALALGVSGASAEARKLPANCNEAKPAIGVALPNTVNPYYIAMQDSFKKNGAAQGFNVNVAIANDNDSNQLSQIDSFVQQGVCAVVLNAVNSGPGAASVRALNQAGIPVFTVNVIVSEDDLKTQNASFIEYVGADQKAGGKQIGEQILKDLGANAKIVVGIIGDPDQIPTNQRDEGLGGALKKNSNALIVGTLKARSIPTSAFRSRATCCRPIPTSTSSGPTRARTP